MLDRRRILQGGIGALGSLSAAAPLRALAQSRRVKVRYNEVVRSIFFGPAYVAITNGYFDEVGIDLTITTAQGGDKSLAALLVGSRARAYFRRLVNTLLRYAHFQSSH